MKPKLVVRLPRHPIERAEEILSKRLRTATRQTPRVSPKRKQISRHASPDDLLHIVRSYEDEIASRERNAEILRKGYHAALCDLAELVPSWHQEVDLSLLSRIVYLKLIRKMSYQQIANQLKNKTNKRGKPLTSAAIRAIFKRATGKWGR
jgi:hypothetical protein